MGGMGPPLIPLLNEIMMMNPWNGIHEFQTNPYGDSTSQMTIWNDFHIPSGQHTKNYGRSPFLIGKPTINSHFPYVSLPEGNRTYEPPFFLGFLQQRMWGISRQCATATAVRAHMWFLDMG